MDLVDGSEHFEDKIAADQTPSLLTVILDTNPLAWSLLEETLSLSSTISSLLVFINAHLACNYTNKVAVIASHSDKAQWLYPAPIEQIHDRQRAQSSKSSHDADDGSDDDITSGPKRVKSAQALNGNSTPPASASGNKYRPFHLIEASLLRSLLSLLSDTSPSTLQHTTSTHIAGAFTLALSYINRQSLLYNDSTMGPNTTLETQSSNPTRLQSRILLLSASPSSDLAHQYIPIMNAIFACQRLSIPIDILQIPPPTTSTQSAKSDTTSASPTVFLQQASDATSGIFIPFKVPTAAGHPGTPELRNACSEALLTYLLTSFLPSPSTRVYLTPPTLINVDFRAACFCHRRVIDLGYVCSICLSIFCAPPEDGMCLTCGNLLTQGAYGKRPVVMARKKKKKKRVVDGGGSGVGTPSSVI